MQSVHAASSCSQDALHMASEKSRFASFRGLDFSGLVCLGSYIPLNLQICGAFRLTCLDSSVCGNPRDANPTGKGSNTTMEPEEAEQLSKQIQPMSLLGKKPVPKKLLTAGLNGLVSPFNPKLVGNPALKAMQSQTRPGGQSAQSPPCGHSVQGEPTHGWPGGSFGPGCGSSVSPRLNFGFVGNMHVVVIIPYGTESIRSRAPRHD